MTLEEIKRKIDDGTLEEEFDSARIVDQGNLINNDACGVEYSISRGWDIIKARKCDNSWASFKSEQVKKALEKKICVADVANILGQDDHWKWFSKSCKYSSDSYEWFYLKAEGEVQGVCLIYHPRDSALAKCSIAYIEYIAVAPWNRNTLVSRKRFKGIGTKLLHVAWKYAVEELSLGEGFCLHSLPQAEGYYSSLGMVYVSNLNKDGMKYFEAPREIITERDWYETS